MKKNGLLFLIVFLMSSFSILAQEYVGEATCLGCHTGRNPEIVNNYKNSGHPYKLNAIEGAHPTYPANTTPGVVLPNGKTWDDFSYVIGGYGWKARFIDKNGKIFTGDTASDSLAQYNLEDSSWVTYHKGEDKAYNYGCFQCHTTGPSEDGSWNANTPGLGTFEEAGIRCEACHGPGSLHAANPSGVKLPNQDDVLKIERCADCHQRGGVTNAIPASGGYIQHHEQVNEMRASKHGDGNGGELTCASCHDSHVPLRYPNTAVNDKVAISMKCQTCHPNKQVLVNGTPKSNDCIDCHMPPASKSAVGMQAGNGWRGDVKTHIMAINTDAVTKEAMFNSEGNLVTLDENGLAAVTLDFACLRCHTSEDVAWASSYAKGIHTNGIVAVDDDRVTPVAFSLEQNYPNPFNPTTAIKFNLPKASDVKLNVYAIDGSLVAELIEDRMPSGNHEIIFDASMLSSGVYVYTISANQFVSSKKMILMK